MGIEFEHRMISSLDDLTSEIIVGQENIIYGAGTKAHTLLRYLQYEGLSRYILCVTVENDSVNPTELYGIPVVSLPYISHFYQTANFYVAVGEKLREEVEEILCSKGCTRVMPISESVFMETWMKFIQMPSNFITDVSDEITRIQIGKLENIVSWQPEVVKTNTEAFMEYKDMNAGREMVLLATGPTASKYKARKDVLHIGVNTAPMLNIPLDYYFAQDIRAFQKISIENAVDLCEGTVFIGRRAGGLAYTKCENITIKGKGLHQYFVNEPCMTANLIKDICLHALTDYYSVVFAALQFALYTHPSRIYLVGCDVSGKLEHFNETSNIVVPHAKYFKLGYGLLKRFAEIYYPDVEICSINPVGLKGLFKDYYTE